MENKNNWNNIKMNEKKIDKKIKIRKYFHMTYYGKVIFTENSSWFAK